MTVMAVVDDRMGLCFHGRRQSQDRVLRAKLLALSAGTRLWMNGYSAKQFAKDPGTEGIAVAEDFLSRAGAGEVCFVEQGSVAEAAASVERLYLFHWNRAYPADEFFDLPLSPGWRMTESEEFPGSSHEKITMEVYERA